MDGEAAGIDAQTNRIIDQRERDEGKQGGNNQQSDTDLCQRIVHLLYQVVLISNLSNTWVCLQFLGNPLQRIVVRVISLRRNLYGRLERVDTGKLARVGTQIAGSFFQCLFLGDISQRIDIRSCIQTLAHLQSLRVSHILFEHHLYHEILLHIGREIASHEDREDNQSQQNEHHSGTDTQSNDLQSTMIARLILFLSHF